jgi:hypothetical protein
MAICACLQGNTLYHSTKCTCKTAIKVGEGQQLIRRLKLMLSPSTLLVVLGSKTYGTLQYTTGQFNKMWLTLNFTLLTAYSGRWVHGQKMCDGCGQPSGESPHPCHGRWSDKKNSTGTPVLLPLGQDKLMEEVLEVQAKDTRYQGTLRSASLVMACAASLPPVHTWPDIHAKVILKSHLQSVC